MAKRRFVAPVRADVPAGCFAHPVFDDYRALEGWMHGPAWPSLDAINSELASAAGRSGIAIPRCVRQDDALLRDGLHYERRVGECGELATRTDDWHDLFNAMVWWRWPGIKQALNRRQCAAIDEKGPAIRNRAQYALTQFDEAGVVVRVADDALLAAWDGHDWPALFQQGADAWRDGRIAVVAVIGHALLEHALVPTLHGVGKALVVRGGVDVDADACVARVTDAIAAGAVLNDPLELRPLPLPGIPGWREGQDAAFYSDAPCFRPLREGRTYPPPITAAG